MKNTVLVSLALSALCALCAACDPENACAPGFHATFGSCVADSVADAGGGSTSKDAAADEDSGAAGNACEPYASFGDACTANATCGCGAPICLTMGLNYCSQVNCLKDPKMCPPKWNCLDVSTLSPDPTVKSVCIKP